MEKKNLTTRDVSTKQENAVAKALGGRRTANSGATSFSKGDVVGSAFLIECKTKMKESASISLQKAWIETLDEERIAMGKSLGALAVSFGDDVNYYVIAERHMKMLIDLLNEEIE